MLPGLLLDPSATIPHISLGFAGIILPYSKTCRTRDLARPGPDGNAPAGSWRPRCRCHESGLRFNSL